MKKYLFGADLGTGGVKAVLLDPETGETVGSDLFEYEMKHPYPLWAEQDPEDWWAMFCAASRQVLARAGECEIIAAALSSQGCATVCVGADGRAIGNAFTWMDGRTGEEAAWLRDHFAEEIAQVNANEISTLLSTPNFLWLKKHDKPRFDRSSGFCGVMSYVGLRLTGRFAVPPSEATFCHLYDYKTHQYSRKLCSLLEIPYEKLPEAVSSTSLMGRVTAQAARECGLPADTPVAGGSHDNTAAALGMGVYQPGQVFFSMGTAGNMGVIMDRPREDGCLLTQACLFPGTWLMLATMGNNGACLKWLRENVLTDASGTKLCYGTLNAYAQASPAGSRGVLFLPYLAGELSPLWDEKARACFIGMTSRTTKENLVRAVMEGVCFSVRHNLTMYERAGCAVEGLRVAGGPTESAVWMQTLADVTGREVSVPDVTNAGPVGDAVLAGVAAGCYPDVSGVLERAVRTRAQYTPNAQNREVYDRLFALYLGLYPKLKNEFSALSSF